MPRAISHIVNSTLGLVTGVSLALAVAAMREYFDLWLRWRGR